MADHIISNLDHGFHSTQKKMLTYVRKIYVLKFESGKFRLININISETEEKVIYYHF